MIGITSIVFSILITLILFFLSRIDNSQNVSLWLLMAKTSGLLGSILISWNYLLATKNKYVEYLFGGLDKLYKIHNIIGNIAFILIVNHPIFLIIDSLPFNTIKIFLIPSLDNLSYAFGILSLYVLILLISLTIFIDLPYKLWKKTHEYIGLVVILASLHGLLIVSDLSSFAPLKYWILGFNILAIIAYVYKRFLYYFLFVKNNYVITEIIHDLNYVVFTLKPTDPASYITFRPGQFAFFALENDLRDDHPFSILEQDGTILKIGAKVMGNFTAKLTEVNIGTKITVRGPFGNFSNNLFKPTKILWISGGIGITPFLTMIKELRPDQFVTMIHTSRSNESKIFIDMLKKLTINLTNFKLVNHYSDLSSHLNCEEISKHIELDSNTYVYICGPKEMMKTLNERLPENGVMKRRIIYEDFSLK